MRVRGSRGPLPAPARWYVTGSHASPRSVALRAGPLHLSLEGSTIRHLRMGRTEVLEALYGAVRDEPWNTIPGTVVSSEVTAGTDHFCARVVTEHAHGDVRLRWQATIEGTADAMLRYQFDGVAGSRFHFARIGLNLVHPVASHRGRPYRVRGGDGERCGVFPDHIAPAPVVDGVDVAMISRFTELEVHLDGLVVQMTTRGDEFEMEDQRNWSDDSYKTFAPPLSRPLPFTAEPGQRIEQEVVVRVTGRPPRRARRRAVEIGPPAQETLPAIGLGVAGHAEPLSEAQVGLLRTLRPAHLRVDLPAGDPQADALLERAMAEARTLGSRLEIALLVGDAGVEPAAGTLARLAEAGAPGVARVVVAPRLDSSTAAFLADARSVASVRRLMARLGLSAPIVAGTDAFFAELNRSADRPHGADGVAYPLSPTMHAWDDASIVANLAVQGEMLQDASRIAAGGSVHVSPVTLATRHGPYPCGPEGVDGLPTGVDPRQVSLLGAAWTVGCLGQLAAAGASSVTLFETSGWRGVTERDTGSPEAARFPSLPGAPYPIFHVLADVADLKGPVHALAVPDPRLVAGLAVSIEGGVRLLLANLRPRAQIIRVRGLAASTARVRVLDVASVAEAMVRPASFRAGGRSLTLEGDELRLRLGAYASARVDARERRGGRPAASAPDAIRRTEDRGT